MFLLRNISFLLIYLYKKKYTKTNTTTILNQGLLEKSSNSSIVLNLTFFFKIFFSRSKCS